MMPGEEIFRMSDDPIKDALNRMPYGFYSITSKSGDEVNAMVANWLTQASFTPRLLALGLAKKAYSFGLIEAGQVFAVNIFNKVDSEAIMPYTKGRARNPEKMANASYSPAPETGCPVLEGAAAFIECKVVQMVDAGGDHVIVVGEAVNAGILKEGEVSDTLRLLDLGWSYAG
jgi:flavin reductase (DIM6/NTAB) family NADH-FMN oxidoreductase RutF